MLEPEIASQLKPHFAALKGQYTLLLAPSRHEKQAELRELLEGVAALSDKLRLLETGAEVTSVQFEILRDGAPTGVRFRGVPGGHEFTSLVLALLNSDGIGKMPDAGILDRVRRLRGPIELRTYVSLSCTNCPEVVQALNLMAIIHGDLRHTMVDGELAPTEVAQLGVQAVPAVFTGDALVHVGKSSFSELLERLEERFGSTPGQEAAQLDLPAKQYDVLVIGGGPAGAAAAIYSARKGLRTAIVTQQLGGQVRDTVGIENLIGTRYTEGMKLAADLDQHLRAYPVEILDHRRVESLEIGKTKTVHLARGEKLEAGSIIIASGARWRELGVPGEKEYLGKGVAFCPHCDGPFYKGRRVAVVGGGNSGVEAAIDLAGICSHVTLFEYLPALKADAVLVAKLESLPNVRIITNARVMEVTGDGQRVTGVLYQPRSASDKAPPERVDLDGVFVQIGLVPNSSFVKGLLEVNRAGEILVDGHCRTSVPGVYAAGDVTNVPFKQIVIAMGEGAKAALSAFEDRIRAGA